LDDDLSQASLLKDLTEGITPNPPSTTPRNRRKSPKRSPRKNP
jgi:hypothetical protein